MWNDRRNENLLRLAASVAALFAFTAPRAAATVRIQQEAVSNGFPATNCNYCHTFDSDHMKDAAKKKGLSRLDCLACHGRRLPKSGASVLNDRGRFLVAVRRHLRVDRVDGAWLKKYGDPAPRPSPSLQSPSPSPQKK
jgi:hypothetical protein